MSTRSRIGIGFVVGAVVLIVGLAAFVSPFASTQPDGLDKVADDHGFGSKAKASAVDDSPLAGYAVKDIHDAKVSKGVSGVAGVGITFVVAATVFGGVRIVVRRRNRAGTARASEPIAA